MPDLDFRVARAEVLEFAAAPTLLFKLHIDNRGAETVKSVALTTQIRIAPALRSYTPEEQGLLFDVFGDTRRWGSTLNSLLWTHTTLLVPAFVGSTLVDMPVPCTYDFDVVSAKYFHALDDGEVPLEFLFSGSIFYAGAAGLQVAQISWEKEAHFQLAVGLWKQMMEHYFPNSAWLRVRKDVFDRLYSYRSRHALPTWEAALEGLLRAGEEVPA